MLSMTTVGGTTGCLPSEEALRGPPDAATVLPGPDGTGGAFLDGFVLNRGQHPSPAVVMYARSPLFEVAFLESEVRMTFLENNGLESGRRTCMGDDPSQGCEIRGCNLRFSFKGAHHVDPIPGARLPWHHNYFQGDDPSGWVTDVPIFSEVVYEDLYDGIDLVYRISDGQLKYELVLSQISDPRAVAIRVEGHDDLRTPSSDLLVLETPVGDVVDSDLAVYYIDDPGESVECEFEVRGEDLYGFDLGHYDATRGLVIDPLVYSTYIGGSDEDECYDMALDGDGNAYITGGTFSADYPTTPGAFQVNHATGLNSDVFVTKLKADGSGLVYSTFLSGWAAEYGNGIFVDDDGEAYIIGNTRSNNFPHTTGAYQEAFVGDMDVFVTKLSSDGSQLKYSTFIGKTGMDRAFDVIVDGSDRAFVAGLTTSSDFPTTQGAYQTNHNGREDVFVLKLAPDGSSLVYSTLVGGSHDDYARGVAIDDDGTAYVTGGTWSTDFPTTLEAFQTLHAGASDAFALKLSQDGSALTYSTLVGGELDEEGQALRLNDDGEAFVVGMTWSDGFPNTTGALQTSQGGNGDAFACRIASDGSSLVYSTYLGGLSIEIGYAIALDEVGNAYLVGYTGSGDFPTTSHGYQTDYGSRKDAFFSKLSPEGDVLLYSTYLGGSGEDEGWAVALDENVSAHVAGLTESPDFPTTPGAYKSSQQGFLDSFVTAFPTDLEAPVADAGPDQSVEQHGGLGFDGGASTDNVKIEGYTWRFNDGLKDVTKQGAVISHTFDVAGRINVTLEVTDAEGYVGRDTMKVTVLDRDPPVADAGDDLTVDQFEGMELNGSLSSDNVGVVNWTWTVSHDDQTWTHYGEVVVEAFDMAGTHTVTLNVTDAEGNYDTDEITVTVQDREAPLADAGPDQEVGLGDKVNLNGTGSTDNVGIVRWTWSYFQDGSEKRIQGPEPSITLEDVDIYIITLNVSDARGNWATDDVTITVLDTTPPRVVAGSDTTLDQDTTFVLDGSSSSDNVGITGYTWYLGLAGRTETLSGARPSFTFDAPGEWEVTLNATDAAGNWAVDTIHITVRDIEPPVAVVGPDVSVDQHGTVILNGTGSSDNVDVEDWTWSYYYDGTQVVLEGPEHEVVFDLAGTYTITLEVTDAAGNPGSVTLTVTVKDDEPPVAVAGPDVNITGAGTVNLDGTGSSDNVGISSWTWTFGYGDETRTLEGQVQTFEFKAPGHYTVTLTVMDEAGNTATDTLTVLVTEKKKDDSPGPGPALVILSVLTAATLGLAGRRTRGRGPLTPRA